ncbi:MAG: hypothetical protein U0821_24050 [Chloroflexota bacterium]
MNWGDPSVQRAELTVFVTDILNSTPVLTRCTPHEARVFLHEFSSLTLDALDRVCDHREQFRIDTFVGDGFLTFISELLPQDPYIHGPARAAAAAIRMRDEFDVLCTRRFGNMSADAQQMKLVSAISFGTVYYGQFTSPAIDRPTGVLSTVVQTFRMAKLRRHASLSRPDYILMCDRSHQEIENLRSAGMLRQYPDLEASTSQPIVLSDLQGLAGERLCFEVR